MALGALEAVKARNLKGIVIIGFDALPEALAQVRDGEITATIEQFPGKQSAIGVDIVADFLKSGKKPEQQITLLTPVGDHQGQPQRGRAPQRGEVSPARSRGRAVRGAPLPNRPPAKRALLNGQRAGGAVVRSGPVGPSDPQDDRGQQALSRRARARGRPSRSRPGRNPRAARRERRRQVDAAQDSVRRAQRRFGRRSSSSASRSPSRRPTTPSAPASSRSIRNSPSPPT